MCLKFELFHLEFPYEEKSTETLHNYEVLQGTFVGSFIQIV
jgi:hypothetical protein